MLVRTPHASVLRNPWRHPLPEADTAMPQTNRWRVYADWEQSWLSFSTTPRMTIHQGSVGADRVDLPENRGRVAEKRHWPQAVRQLAFTNSPRPGPNP